MKVWSDLKNNTRRKLAKQTEAGITHDDQIAKLTDLERRVVAIVRGQVAIADVDEAGLPQVILHMSTMLISKIAMVQFYVKVGCVHSPKSRGLP